jgi:hypothetical protein
VDRTIPEATENCIVAYICFIVGKLFSLKEHSFSHITDLLQSEVKESLKPVNLLIIGDLSDSCAVLVHEEDYVFHG